MLAVFLISFCLLGTVLKMNQASHLFNAHKKSIYSFALQLMSLGAREIRNDQIQRTPGVVKFGEDERNS